MQNLSRKVLLLTVLLVFIANEIRSKPPSDLQRPRLVVGIVVDQMRQEYLARFESKLGPDGFKRMMYDGFMVRNAHYNYSPTVTGPGHATVFSGTTPSAHGVIGNEWYHRTTGKIINCVQDDSLPNKGTGLIENRSPKNLMVTNLADEIKLFFANRSKVIGISLKDRGAILPSGHLADAAYWYDDQTGNFISSTYYMDDLPEWVKEFNHQQRPDQYLNETWNTLMPLSTYKESFPDDSPHEKVFKGKEKAVFPYDLKKLRKLNGEYALLKSTHYGNEYLADLARAVITNENLGQDEDTDFLSVSFSSTDVVGHNFGPRSVEVEDLYLRLDRTLASLFDFLDANIGAHEYLVFLTADHGVAENPFQVKEFGLSTGVLIPEEMRDYLNQELSAQQILKEWVLNVSNYQVYLNKEFIAGQDKSMEEIKLIVKEQLLALPSVSTVFTTEQLLSGNSGSVLKQNLINGYHQQRGGDLFFTIAPGWVEGFRVVGSQHGSGYNYDSHVPFLLYGKGVKKGSTWEKIDITQLAPTICGLLRIPFPSASDRRPVVEAIGDVDR